MCSITFNRSRAHRPLYLRVYTLLARKFQNIQYSRVSRLQKTRFIRPRILNNSPPYSCLSLFLFFSFLFFSYPICSAISFLSVPFFFCSFFIFFSTFFGRFRRYSRPSKIIAVSFNARCVRVHIHTIHIHRLSIISYEFFGDIFFERRHSRASLS